MKRIAVIDSSSLINLAHLQLAPKLALYFSAIYVPRRVQIEVCRKSKFRYRLNKLYKAGLFQRCVCADEVRVALLTRDLDGGEAEALMQAQEKGASHVIADERRARQIGERQGMLLVGTVRLLARLHLEGHAAETWLLVRKLRSDVRFRVANNVVESAIASASDPI